MHQKPDGTWDAATARADWERINSTTDAEIERQEIADLVEAALHLQVGGLSALAARLDVSPSSVASAPPPHDAVESPGAAGVDHGDCRYPPRRDPPHPGGTGLACLADALLDFQSPADLAAWLAGNA